MRQWMRATSISKEKHSLRKKERKKERSGEKREYEWKKDKEEKYKNVEK